MLLSVADLPVADISHAASLAMRVYDALGQLARITYGDLILGDNSLHSMLSRQCLQCRSLLACQFHHRLVCIRLSPSKTASEQGEQPTYRTIVGKFVKLRKANFTKIPLFFFPSMRKIHLDGSLLLTGQCHEEVTMALVAAIMAKKSFKEPEERRPEHVEYVSVKIDGELPHIVREAAARKRISVQELMSTLINEGCAAILDREAIQRRTPPRGK